jgi:hypothetical protein
MTFEFCLLSFAFGLWLADLAWKFKIEDKAEMGIRLECRGRLYDVRESDNGS